MRAPILAPVFLALLLLVAPASAREVKLATWNLNWLTRRPMTDPVLPPGLEARRPEDLARLRDYARRLSADILALQEVDGPEAAALVLEPAEWQLFFPDEADVQRAAVAVRRGLPARRNPDLVELDLAPDSRRSQRRGVDVTVGEGAGALRVLSVHLNAGCREPADAGRACDALFRQGEVLAGWIAARAASGEAFAVAGDLNRRLERDAAFPALLARGAALLRVTEGRSNPCWGGRPFIDHVLLGGPAREWLRPGSLRVLVYEERGREWMARLSDHCPVSVVLRLP